MQSLPGLPVVVAKDVVRPAPLIAEAEEISLAMKKGVGVVPEDVGL